MNTEYTTLSRVMVYRTTDHESSDNHSIAPASSQSNCQLMVQHYILEEPIHFY